MYGVQHQARAVLQAKEKAEKRQRQASRHGAGRQRGSYKKAPASGASDAELRQRIEQRRASNDAQAALASVAGHRGEHGAPVLLVDGYNVAHKHLPSLAHLQRDELHAARGIIEDMCAAFARAEEAEVTVVWDAMGNEGARKAGRARNITERHGAITVVYAIWSEADTHIVCTVQRLRDAGAGTVVVATDDVDQAGRVSFDAGGRTISTAQFLRRVEAIGAGARERGAVFSGAEERRQRQEDELDALYAPDANEPQGASALCVPGLAEWLEARERAEAEAAREAASEEAAPQFNSAADEDAAASLGLSAPAYYRYMQGRASRREALQQQMLDAGLWDSADESDVAADHEGDAYR